MKPLQRPRHVQAGADCNAVDAPVRRLRGRYSDLAQTRAHPCVREWQPGGLRCSLMEAERSSGKRARTRGQTMTEFALVVPVLLVLIMGVLDGALLMFSVGTARYSSAEGSRVAATLGNVANTHSQVVGTIRQTVGTTQLFTVDEIDIYKLNQDGNGNLTPDLAHTNKYALDGTPLNRTPWPASSRNVGNGTSDFIR